MSRFPIPSTKTLNHQSTHTMPTYTPPSTASPAHKVFASFINAFGAFNVDDMLSYLDSTATFTLLPKAMGVPPMSKKHLGPYFKTQIIPAFDTMEVC